MRNSNNFSVLFWTNKAKADSKGLVPLYARVTVEGKRAEISLKKKVNPKKWDAKSGFMVGNGEEVRIMGVSEICYTLFRGKTDHLFAGKEMQLKLSQRNQR